MSAASPRILLEVATTQWANVIRLIARHMSELADDLEAMDTQTDEAGGTPCDD